MASEQLLSSGFPVHVKVRQWFRDVEVVDDRVEFENEDVTVYFQDLVSATLYFGIGAAFFTTFLLVWFCCCCHCGPSSISKPQERSPSCPSVQRSRTIAITTLLLVICMTSVGIGLFVFGLHLWYIGTDAMITDSQGAAVDAGDFLCTADISEYNRNLDRAQCSEYSLDGFIWNINTRTLQAFGQVSEVIVAISSILVQVDSILENLDTSAVALTAMDTALKSYQISSMEVISLLNELNSKDPSQTPIINANIPDASIVPLISFQQIEQVEDANRELESSKVSVTDVHVQVAEEIDRLNTVVVPEINAIKIDVLEITSDVQKVIYDSMENLENSDDTMEDVRELIKANKKYFWIWIGVMCPLALLVPFVALWSVVYAKPRCPACSCGFQFIAGVTFWLPIIVGIFLFVYTLLDDTCDNLLVGNEKSGCKGLFEVSMADYSSNVGHTEVIVGNVIN
jgi:hypothetical protein